MKIPVLVATLAASTFAIPMEIVKREYNCNGPFIVAVRGSGPDPNHPECANSTVNEQVCESGLSKIIGLVTSNFSDWPGSDTGLAYPAVTNNFMGNYEPSVKAGMANLTTVIKSFVGQCGSSSKVVLLGYSQGAQVVSNTLGGGYGIAPLPANYTQYIKAAAVFGDPTFRANQTYDAGNATTNGVIQTSSSTPQTLAPYKNVYRSYCTSGDEYCASGTGSDALYIHHQEIKAWATDASKFIIGLLRAGGVH